jgi:hypothetical protein
MTTGVLAFQNVKAGAMWCQHATPLSGRPHGEEEVVGPTTSSPTPSK